LRIWDSSFLIVGENPDWNIVHKETASIHQTITENDLRSSNTGIHKLSEHGNYPMIIYAYTACWRFQRKE
jgi:hypothetical protein